MADGQVVIEITGDDAEFKKTVSSIPKSLESSGKSMFGIGKRLTKYVTAPVMAAGSVIAGFALKTAGSFEETSIAFETMLGSKDAGKKMFEDLKAFAKKTPFELPGVLDASKKLLAYGFAADRVVPMLRSVGDASAGLSLGAEGMDRIITALGQMKAKGKISAEEMLQLTEAGIPAWDALAKKLGVDIPTAMDMVTKGAVDSGTGISSVLDMMDSKFGGLMAKQSNSLDGLWSNLKDTFTVKLGDALQKSLPQIKSLVVKAIAAAGPLIDALIPALTGALTALTPVLDTVIGLLKAFSSAPAGVQEAIMKVLAALTLAGPVIQVFGTIATVVGAVAGAVSTAVSVIGAVISAGMVGGIGDAFAALLAAIGGPATLIIAAIAAIGAVGFLLWKNWDSIKAALVFIWTSLSEVAGMVLTAIRSDFATTISGVKLVFDGLRSYFAGAWQVIRAIFLGAILIITDIFTGKFGKLASDARGIGENIKAAFDKMWSGVRSIFSGGISMVVGLFTEVIPKLRQAGANIVHGLIDGISSAWKLLTSKVYDLAESINKTVRAALGIHSPSTVMFKDGQYSGQGLVNGILKMRRQVTDAAARLAASAVDAVEGSRLASVLSASTDLVPAAYTPTVSAVSAAAAASSTTSTYYQIGDVSMPASDPAVQQVFGDLMRLVRQYQRMRPTGAM